MSSSQTRIEFVLLLLLISDCYVTITDRIRARDHGALCCAAAARAT